MIGFRFRGETPSRIEALSDAVFGFSLTLLVVSLEVPRTFSELKPLIAGFLPFALCFALFIHTWYLHHRFFRRYGLRDVSMVWLNSILLFLTMFFIYPLKFLATFLVRIMSGDPMTVQGADGSLIPILAWDDALHLHLLFTIGFAAVHVTFLAMHARVVSLRRRLELNELEMFDTRTAIREHGIFVAFGFVSALIATMGGHTWIPAAGWLFFFLGPAMGIHGYVSGKRRERLTTATNG